MGTQHELSVLSNNHAVTAATYADVAARNADTLFNLNAVNIDKVVRVDGPPVTLYQLISVTGVAANDWMTLANFQVDAFLGLSDTPGTYSGESLKAVRVNSGETGLEFTDLHDDNIYTIDGAVTSDRQVTMNSGRELRFDQFDGTESAFSLFDQIALLPGEVRFRRVVGNGTTAQISEQGLVFNGSTMLVTDSTNSLGFQYLGDYSANNSANPRWLPDKAYVDNHPDGDVIGPASSTDDALVRFDGTTGLLIKSTTNGILTDAGALSGLTLLTVDNMSIDGNTLFTTDTNGNLILSPNGTGSVNVASSKVINVFDPTDAQDAATKNYVDTHPGAGTIYLTDGSFSATARLVEGENASSLNMRMADLTSSDFTIRGLIFLSDAITFLGFQEGDGAGNVTDQSAINFTPSVMQVRDEINSTGLVYAADYVTNGAVIDRWIPDIAGVRAEAFYTADGTVSGGRTVSGDGDFLRFNVYDTDAATFLTDEQFVLNVGEIRMSHLIGSGSGGIASQKSLTFTSSSMTVLDTTSQIGLQYSADYSTNGLLVANGRWIPDLTAVRAETIYGTDGSVTANRTIDGNGNFILFNSFDTDGATFTEQAQVDIDVGTVRLSHFVGNGLGAQTSQRSITLSTGSMLVTDTTTSIGFIYAADYSTAGSALDRWIPDKQFIDNNFIAGPGVVTNDSLVRFDGTTGLIVDDSVALLDDAGGLSGLTRLEVDDLVINGNSILTNITNGSIVLNPDGTGNVNVNVNQIINVEDPTAAQDAATKNYVDNAPNSTKLKVVRVKDDLGTLAAGVITSPTNTNLYIVESIDMGTDRLVISAGGSITGIRNTAGGSTVLSGTTTGALVTASAIGVYLDIAFLQNGAGDVFDFDPSATPFQDLIFRRVTFEGGILRMQNSAFAMTLFTCNVQAGASVVIDANCTGSFFGASSTSLFTDAADGDVLIRMESGATLDRIQIAFAATVQSFASTGILIEDGAVPLFLDFLNAGFNLFDSDAIAIQCDDVDAVGAGLIQDSQFTPGAVNLRSSPTVDSSFSVATTVALATDSTILNGNMFLCDFDPSAGYNKYVGLSNTLDGISPVLVGTRLRGITSDGFNIIVTDDTTNLVNVMTGDDLPVDFTFATPGADPRGAAFDGEDLWIVDQVDDLVYQMVGLTATVKNSFAPRVANAQPGALDVDGTIVIVGDATNNTFEFYTPTGTFLYDFPSPQVIAGGGTGISHQADTYIVNAHNDDIIYIYIKSVPFHQGSKTWRIQDSDITMSASRIVTRFAVAPVTVTPVSVAVFRDISDAGVDLVWGAASTGFEKFLVIDALNGETQYVGSREMSVNVSASFQLARSTGSTILIEVALFLNGDLFTPSLFPVTLDSNNVFNITTASFTLRLKENDQLLLQFRNLTNTSGVDFSSVVLSA